MLPPVSLPSAAKARPAASAAPEPPLESSNRTFGDLRVRDGGGADAECARVACTHANDDGPGTAKLADDLGVGLGTIAGQEGEPRRAYGRRRIDNVLDCDRNARKGPHPDARARRRSARSASRRALSAVTSLKARKRGLRRSIRSSAVSVISIEVRSPRSRMMAAAVRSRGGSSRSALSDSRAVLPCGFTPVCSPRQTVRFGHSSLQYRRWRGRSPEQECCCTACGCFRPRCSRDPAAHRAPPG